MKAIKPVAVILAIIAIIYFYPRILLSIWDPADPWLNYLYQYGFGFITFLVGIWVILKTGACQPGRGRDGLWLGILVAGFVIYASVHALWIVAAQYAPYLGGS